jgi:hypothetical protein
MWTALHATRTRSYWHIVAARSRGQERRGWRSVKGVLDKHRRMERSEYGQRATANATRLDGCGCFDVCMLFPRALHALERLTVCTTPRESRFKLKQPSNSLYLVLLSYFHSCSSPDSGLDLALYLSYYSCPRAWLHCTHPQLVTQKPICMQPRQLHHSALIRARTNLSAFHFFYFVGKQPLTPERFNINNLLYCLCCQHIRMLFRDAHAVFDSDRQSLEVLGPSLVFWNVDSSVQVLAAKPLETPLPLITHGSMVMHSPAVSRPVLGCPGAS